MSIENAISRKYHEVKPVLLGRRRFPADGCDAAKVNKGPKIPHEYRHIRMRQPHQCTIGQVLNGAILGSSLNCELFFRLIFPRLEIFGTV